MPTIFDVLATTIESQLSAAKEKDHIEKFFQPLIELAILGGMALVKIQAEPPSPGYKLLFAKNGVDHTIAQAIARIAVRSGRRQALESRESRQAFAAIRFLAVPRRKSAVRAKAKFLLRNWETTSNIENAFYQAEADEREFITLLREVNRATGFEDYDRLQQIAASIAPHLVMSRGPKVGAASAAHGFLLGLDIEDITKKRPDVERTRGKQFCDPLTEATQREFGLPEFDSRPAKRRRKSVE